MKDHSHVQNSEAFFEHGHGHTPLLRAKSLMNISLLAILWKSNQGKTQ
jgi:hypothetical protein